MFNMNIFEREDLTPIRKLLLMKAIAGGAAISEYTETGNPVEFNTNIAKALGIVAAFSPVQSGSGDPSPDNVRPITGFSGANVYLSATGADDPDKQTFAVTFPALGKNLFDVSTIVKGTLDSYGNLIANDNRRVSAFITLPAGTYVASRKTAPDWWKLWAYTQDETPLRSIFDFPGTSRSFTLTEETKVRFAFDYVVTSDDEVQLESGSSETAYEPYTNTAYGGTLDLTTGVLTVVYAAKVVRGTDLFYASTGYIKSDAFDAFLYINDVYGSLGMCNMLKRSNAGIWGDVGYPNTFRINSTQLHINIANDLLGITDYTQETSTTATQKLKAWLEELYNNGTPLIVVYPIATPLVYQLTPTEILSLVGDNVIWSDLNGVLTVTYKKKG